MLVQEELQKKICDFLAILEVSTENRALIGLLDQHLISQSFIAKLLNIVYGYDLVNLDSAGRRYPAIDLGDFYRKVSFQVTSVTDKRKYTESIETFIRREQYKDFRYLKFFILGKKRKKNPEIHAISDLFEFDPEKDILDIKDIVREISSLSLDKLQRLSYLIDSESSGLAVTKTTYQILQASYDEDNLPVEEQNPDNVVKTVHRTNIPLYADSGCQQLRTDMTGVILDIRQQPGNISAGYCIHPTSSNLFQEGMRVIRVYSRNRSCQESWYRNPDTDEITYAWSSSCELIGRIVD